MSDIQIKFLTLDEMANARNIDWRYEHVGIDNLGFADKKKNRVFVRAGLEPQLQHLLIDHELSHLFELEGTDEDEHGIRHKKKGGFMRTIVPIVAAIIGSIALPGVGTALGLGSGGLLGAGLTGAGAMLGGVAGSSATGKPNWLGNTISGAAAGVGSGIGSAIGGIGATGGSGIGGSSGSFSEVLGNGLSSGINSQLGNAGALTAGSAGSGIGSSIGSSVGSGIGSLFTGALGSGQSARGGYNSTSSNQSFRMPDLSQNQNANPTFSGWDSTIGLPDVPGFAGPGAEALTNSRGMGSQSKMPLNPGLGQAGINLSGQEMNGGFNRMFGQGETMNPMMDNTFSNGQFSF